MYRLMQFSFRDVLEQAYGTAEADRIFYDAGHLAGLHFYANLIGPTQDINQFISKLQHLLKEYKVGILRMEEMDLENGRLVITVSEDLDCSGLPDREFEFCTWDEGFIAGLLESFSTRKFTVKEVDCWCTGDRTCRFSAQSTG
jgi:predicted hydrocarbon binding protein